MRNILIFGSQGSGKSTHGKYIADRLNLPYLSTGDLFRKIQGEKSELGKKVKSLLDSGELVPDDLTNELLERNLPKEGGFVLDGYPRNVDQANHFSEKIDLIFLIKVPEDLAVKRLLKRSREDDSSELIKRRIEIYNKLTRPVIDYYRHLGVKVIEVDNTPGVQEVQKEINDYLKNAF